MTLSLSVDVERRTKECRVGDTKMEARTYDVVLTHRRKGKKGGNGQNKKLV